MYLWTLHREKECVSLSEEVKERNEEIDTYNKV
jgi:hypothetical protein